MNPKFKITALALATAVAIGASGPSNATTITNLDGTFSFGGIDWSAEGQAWVTGYGITNASPVGTVDAFTLYYQSTATALVDGGGSNYLPPGMRPQAGATYEYTIFATITETATCIADLVAPFNGLSCDLVSFTVTGGSYDAYYDTNTGTFASYAAGTGFRDGTHLLGGSITGASPVFAPQGATNPGNASVAPTVFGDVSFQSPLIVPSLNSTTDVTTLQFGTSIQNTWVRPAAFDGIGPTGSNTNTDFVAQSDGNQSFSRVPEPASLALLGLGLAALGFSSRRRVQ